MCAGTCIHYIAQLRWNQIVLCHENGIWLLFFCSYSIHGCWTFFLTQNMTFLFVCNLHKSHLLLLGSITYFSCFQFCEYVRCSVGSHYENTPIQKYKENFTSKNWKFSDKKSDIFHISAQNIDCGYPLERRGGSNEYQLSLFLSKNVKNNVYSY